MLLFQSWTGQAFWKQFGLKHISLSLGHCDWLPYALLQEPEVILELPTSAVFRIIMQLLTSESRKSEKSLKHHLWTKHFILIEDGVCDVTGSAVASNPLGSIPHPSAPICTPPHLIIYFRVTCLLLSPNFTNTDFYFWWSLLSSSITYDPYSCKYKNIKSMINIWDKTFNICAFAYVCVHVYMPMYVLCVCPCLCTCVHVYMCIYVCVSTDAYANVWICFWFKVDWLQFSSLITLHFVLWGRVLWFQISLSLASLANNSPKDLHVCLLSTGITRGCLAPCLSCGF